MAIEKARQLQPLQRFVMDVTPTALVIGGGVSGLVAAKAIADKGFSVYLLEQEESLGGRRVTGYSLPFESPDFGSLLDPLIENVTNHEKITVYTSIQLREVRGALGRFTVTFTQKKEHKTIDVGVIINATGSMELKPHGLYGYGESDKILVLSDLTETIESISSTFSETIVMLLCAGSREKKDRTYCTSTCCYSNVTVWVS